MKTITDTDESKETCELNKTIVDTLKNGLCTEVVWLRWPSPHGRTHSANLQETVITALPKTGEGGGGVNYWKLPL